MALTFTHDGTCRSRLRLNDDFNFWVGSRCLSFAGLTYNNFVNENFSMKLYNFIRKSNFTQRYSRHQKNLL